MKYYIIMFLATLGGVCLVDILIGRPPNWMTVVIVLAVTGVLEYIKRRK